MKSGYFTQIRQCGLDLAALVGFMYSVMIEKEMGSRVRPLAQEQGGGWSMHTSEAGDTTLYPDAANARRTIFDHGWSD